MRGRAAGVEGQVDRDRHRHAADPGQQRQREPPPLAQLAQVELPARLEPDDEEEERHQAAVHPVAQIQRDPAPPRSIDSVVPQSDSYDDASTFTQRSAATAAASRTAAPPVSVRRNSRSGVWRLRAHAVRPENGESLVLGRHGVNG